MIAHFYMVDADKSLFNKAAAERKITDTKDDVADKKEVKEEESIWKPKTVKWNFFYAIQLGAILDNFGSAGLIMCMSPLMFYEYQVDQMMVGEDPIMSETQFKWLTTLVVRSFHHYARAAREFNSFLLLRCRLLRSCSDSPLA